MAQLYSDPVLPTAQDALHAGEVRHAIERLKVGTASLRVQVNDAAFDLPPLVARLLMGILDETAAGHAVTLMPVEAELTTQQAAEMLGVSRPFLVGLIDKGMLPARMVGNRHRLPLKDVLAYKADNRAKRRETLREMAAIDQELGLYE